MSTSDKYKDPVQFNNLLQELPSEKVPNNLSEKILKELDNPTPKPISSTEKWYGLTIGVISVGLITPLFLFIFSPQAEENASQNNASILVTLMLAFSTIGVLFFFSKLRATKRKVNTLKSGQNTKNTK